MRRRIRTTKISTRSASRLCKARATKQLKREQIEVKDLTIDELKEKLERYKNRLLSKMIIDEQEKIEINAIAEPILQEFGVEKGRYSVISIFKFLVEKVKYLTSENKRLKAENEALLKEVEILQKNISI